jgi:hypothetical protein
MSTSLSMPEKLTVQESQSWLQENLTALVGLGDTEFIQAIHDLKAAIPKKPRVSKKTPVSERADAPYDEEKCDARVWLKPGNFAGQCSCKKVEGQFLCKRHQSETEKHSGVTRNGFYNQERPTHAFGDTDDEVLGWHDVVSDKPEKKTNTKTSGDRKKRSCGNCGQCGHDKRKCPNATKESSDKPMSVAELTQMLAEAKALEEKLVEEMAEKEKVEEEKVEEEKVEEIDDDKTQACSTGEDLANLSDFNGDQLEEDQPLSPKSQEAAGTGLVEVTDQLGEEDLDVSGGESEEEGETVDCSTEGIPYSRNSTGVVYDDDFDPVGTWVDGKIVFDKFGAKVHKKAVASL